MEKPLVSVIIPVYNMEKYLAECLDSVCGQSYKNLEIVLVNNNSTDGSLDIACRYAAHDERIVIYDEVKQGLGAARDKGLDEAKGEWICFVDSDDFIHPRFVEMLLCPALEYHCLTVQCRYEKIYCRDIHFDSIGESKVTLLEWREFVLHSFRNCAKGYAPFGVTTNIHHRSLFENNRFDGLRYGEDSYIAPRLLWRAASHPIGIIDQPLYFYYIREGSILHSKPTLRMLDHSYAKEYAASFWREKGEQALYDWFYSIYFSTLVMDYLRFCVYLPRERNQYEILKEKIMENYAEAKTRGEENLLLPPGAKAMWERLTLSDAVFIQYGYGDYGQMIHPFLRDGGLAIKEIWDMKADDNKKIDGIPICKPHAVNDQRIVMLIAIKDELTNLEIKIKMEQYGIKEFVPCKILKYALRYGMYEKYLPILLKNYEFA